MSDYDINEAIARFEYQLNLSSTNEHAPATIADVKRLAKLTAELFRALAESQDS